MSGMTYYPENDYRSYLCHDWNNHKYVAIRNGRYIYPEDLESDKDSSPGVIYAPGVKKKSSNSSSGSNKKGIAVIGAGGKEIGRYSTAKAAQRVGRLGRDIDEEDDEKETKFAKTRTIYAKRKKTRDKVKNALNKTITSKATKKAKSKKRKKS